MTMLIFFSTALLIYGIMHFYAFGKLCAAFPNLSRPALALIATALTFSPLLARYGGIAVYVWATYLWMGYLFLFVCIGLLFDFAGKLGKLAGFNWRLPFSVTPLLALMATGYGLLEARQIQVERIEISTPKLASGKVTIAQISDLHLGLMMEDEFIARVNDKLGELRPDLIVATGDILDGHGGDLGALALHLKTGTAPLGRYAVIGNHEQYAGLERSLNFFDRAGYTVLRGTSVSLGGITLSGIDDPGRGNKTLRPARPAVATNGHGKVSTPENEIRHARSLTPAPPLPVPARGIPAECGSKAARTGVKGEGYGSSLREFHVKEYTVLLKHQPVIDSAMPFDLQLSGHIHGGQIFPFVYLTRLVYSVHTGLTRLPDGRLLYVSRGTGTWGPPMRLFAPPEITLFTITSSNK